MTGPARGDSRFLLVFAALAVCLLAVWFFGGLLFADRVPAAGDWPAFYDPLLRFTQAQWSAGRLPLWNPGDNLGQPLLASGTSSVFYPAKLLFFLPIGFERACAWYIVLHVALAGAGVYRLARHWQCSRTAAGLAALSYAFGGQVVYQYSNIVFLVGAAWLPVALERVDHMLRARSVRAALGLAVVLALIVLGGDPQTAYHVGLIAVIEALWLGRRKDEGQEERLRGPNTIPNPLTPAPLPPGERGVVLGPLKGTVPGGERFWHHRLVLLAVAAGGAAVLAAVQVVPSAEFARRSDRTITDFARSLYEIPATLRHDDVAQRIARGLAAQPAPGTYYEHVFDYSVGPWRLPELFWPNVSGRSFPIDRRWLAKIDGQQRVWTPSLYLGFLPLLLALLGLRFRSGAEGGGAALDHGLTWLALLSLLGSFGGYGLGWLAHYVVPHAGRAAELAESVGGPCGGLYWLMTYVLPGYLQFRYPGKLFTLVALAVAILAARGWDEIVAGNGNNDEGSRRLRRLAAGVGATSLAGLLAVLAARPWWPRLFDAGASPHPLFGPLDTSGAFHDVALALAQTALLCSGVWLLAGKGISPIIARKRFNRKSAPGNNWTYPPWVSCVVLAVTAVDLAGANGWLVATVPAELVRRAPRLAQVIRDAAGRTDGAPPRIHRQDFWAPDRWQRSAAADRWEEIVAWDRDTLFMNHPIAAGLASTELWGTLMVADYNAWLAAAGERATPRFAEVFIGEGLSEPKHSRPVALSQERGRPDVEDVSLWRNEQVLPRAWIAHDFLRLAPIDDNDDDALLARSREVLFDGDKPRDLVSRPTVEAGRESDLPSTVDQPTARDALPGESCRIARYEPNRVEIDVELDSSGLVILADQFFAGWKLVVTSDGRFTRETPILRTNRVLRGCWLPPGRHTLNYCYVPTSFRYGAAITAAGWTAIVVTAIFLICRAARQKRRRLHLPESGRG